MNSNHKARTRAALKRRLSLDLRLKPPEKMITLIRNYKNRIK